MKPELRKLIVENLKDIHKRSKQIVEDTGGHPPVFIVLRDKNAEIIDFSEYIEDKDLMAVMIKAYQSEDGIDGTILLTEAWVTHVAPDSAEGKRIAKGLPGVRPSESPDRKEVLFYMVETPGGMLAAQAPIIRNGDETTVGDLEFMDSDDSSLKGRFVGGSFNP